MEILSVSLKNFKSHSDRHFVFQPGTNAICGENGAGKTSILEAIAWVLFDYKGDYRLEDLIRNGSNSGQARVRFVSQRDQRTYEIERCTRSGYTIFDPQLQEKLRYTRIKEEVLPWLRENLGVAPGTDLAKLFANTIGVPQGTFTADFLQTAERRRPVFDAILKVEEYRQVTQKMLSLEKYAKAQSDRLEQQIAQYDESLQEWEPLSQQRDTLAQDINQLELEFKHWQQQFDQLKIEQEKYTQIAVQIQKIENQLTTLNSRCEAETANVERLRLELEISEKAVAICTERRSAYQAYQAAEQTLQQFERDRRTQESYLKNRQSSAEQLNQIQLKIATLNQQLERRSQLESDLQQIAPLIQQQDDLEGMQQQQQKRYQQCQSWRQTMERDQQRQQQIIQRQRALSAEIEHLENLGATVKQIPQLEAQQQRYQEQLSRIEAATQFEADLRQMMIHGRQREEIHRQQVITAATILQSLQTAAPTWQPQLTEILHTLQQGGQLSSQLMGDMQNIIEDLSEQILSDRLRDNLRQVLSQLQTVRQQQAQYLTLEAKFDQEETLNTELKEVLSQITQSQQHLAAEPEIQQQLAHLTEQLTSLGNPRERRRLLQQELAQQQTLAAQQQTLQTKLEQVNATIVDLDRQLAPFANLSEQIQAQQQIREQLRSDYQYYLEHQQSANSYKPRQSQLASALEQLSQWQQQIQACAEQRQAIATTYDPEQVSAIQQNYEIAKTQQIQLNSRLPVEQKRLADYDQQMTKLQQIQTKRNEVQTQQQQQQKTERLIKFARKAYKEAGPRITERYVQTITREADRLFRELLNRPNVALEWTRDYEIMIQEGAHPRRFVNLSGGEQMCAALAVRLALLRTLADIDIAFFDEPTTNMDKPRRDSLADAIAHLKSFRQLFVISHDDTFEKATENVIVVEREA